MLVYLRDGSTQIEIGQVRFSASPSHSVLTLDQTSPSAGPITPGAWQAGTGVPVFYVSGMTRPGEKSSPKAGIEPRSGACLFVGCLTSTCECISGRICSDNFTCCHTEIEAADQTFYLTQSLYADIRPTSPSNDPVAPGAWQGNHWYDSTLDKSRRTRDSKLGSSAIEADTLTTRSTRRPVTEYWHLGDES